MFYTGCLTGIVCRVIFTHMRASGSVRRKYLNMCIQRGTNPVTALSELNSMQLISVFMGISVINPIKI
jgi:hypothetical protein